MLYRALVDASPVTEGVTLFKHQLLLNYSLTLWYVITFLWLTVQKHSGFFLHQTKLMSQ